MGIDYRAVYGMGFEISIPDCDELMELGFDDEYEYMESLGSEDIYVDDTNNHVSGNPGEVYIFIRGDRLKGDVNLADIEKKLRDYCDVHNIEIISEFGICGGIKVW